MYFLTSKEVTVTITTGMSAELVDALVVALGSRFKSLSSEDMQAIEDMYTAMLSTRLVANAAEGNMASSHNPSRQGTMPHVLIETGGDEATGSPATRVAATCPTNETLSSPEDDSSLDKAPSGEVPLSLLISEQLPPWQRFG